jgi:hypothetical protein
MTPNRYVLGVLFCLSLSCFPIYTQTAEKPAGKDPQDQTLAEFNTRYHQLVQRVKSGDASVDFIEMRDAFAEWLCDDRMQADSPNRDAMVKAFDDKNYVKAVELVEVILDNEFVHLGLHRAAADAYQELGNKTKADFHKNIADRLLHALMRSGDGKTAQSAYRVLTIKEEYFVMNELGYGVSGQALMSENNKPYDVLFGRDKKGKSVSIYFDISSFFGGCKRTANKKSD